MDRYYDLTEDTIETFKDVFKSKSFFTEIKFDFIGDQKQKGLIKIVKIPDNYSFKLGKQLQVVINEDLFMMFDDESINILFEQELDKISVSLDSGKIKLVKPDVNTFSSLIVKHGFDKVSRANQIDVSTSESDDVLNSSFNK